jgi:hypothetical protein
MLYYILDGKAPSVANTWKGIKEVLQRREEIEKENTNHVCGRWVNPVGVLHHAVCPAHTCWVTMFV